MNDEVKMPILNRYSVFGVRNSKKDNKKNNEYRLTNNE